MWMWLQSLFSPSCFGGLLISASPFRMSPPSDMQCLVFSTALFKFAYFYRGNLFAYLAVIAPVDFVWTASCATLSVVFQALGMFESSQRELADARFQLRQMGVNVKQTDNLKSETQLLTEHLKKAREMIQTSAIRHRADVGCALWRAYCCKPCDANR